MAEKKKTEVNLEMCSGFFRIPTDEIIYNITVLASNDSSTTKVVEKIIEVEKIVEVERKSPRPATGTPPIPTDDVSPPPPGDDYFQNSVQRLGEELSAVARDTDKEPTAKGGPDLDAIRDLATMASDLKEVLLAMKGHPLLHTTGRGSTPPAQALSRLAGRLNEALALSGGEAPPSPIPTTPPATTTVTRYLFNLDSVFQTIYELCTNETVKGHIQSARAKANEIFDKEVFYDAISPKVGGYPEDDGFLNVPMTDIYTALGSACKDKAIGNLLTKMDKQQAAIFLDQFLPLEVPPREEVTVPLEGGEAPAGVPTTPPGGGGGEITALLGDCQADLNTLFDQLSPPGDQQLDADDLLTKVEEAITITANIHYEANRLADAGTAGQGEATAASRIKGLALLAEALLDEKAANPAMTFAEGVAAAEAARQRALGESASKPKPAPPQPPKEVGTKRPPAQENFGEASQDDIDRLLEELG